MSNRVWVVGSANMDLVFNTPRFPKPGETLLGGTFKTFPGGKGANQAVAIGKLEGDAAFVGCVGDDAFGELLAANLQECGVDVQHLLRHSAAATGCAAILVDKHGRNEIVVAPGANVELLPSFVSASLQEDLDAPVLVQLEIPLDAVEAVADGRRVFLNPAPARILPDSLLSKIYAITPNETEAELLTGILPCDEASCCACAHILLDRGVRNVVITLGERGCFWSSAKGQAFFSAPSVKAVDTVAAGDAFNGALVCFLAQGRDWPSSLVLANHVAALSVTKAGAQPSMPALSELRAFAPDLL